MKHPVSVAELLELHRLGELYVKWASNAVAMSDEDLAELEKLTEMYSIPGTSALFAFQKQFHNEFGLTAANSMSIQKVAEEVLAIAGARAEIRHPENPVEYVRDSDGAVKPTAFSERYERPTGAEMDGALREQLHEDNEVDRESAAQYRADQLRDELVDGEMSDERETAILREISNVDSLTPAESARLGELLAKQEMRPVQSSGTHRIPVGLVQDAISTGQMNKIG